MELNPAHVTAQRKVNGQRGVKTYRVDLTAIFDLIVAGRGNHTGQVAEAMVELSAWVAHRRRRVHVRTALVDVAGDPLEQLATHRGAGVSGGGTVRQIDHTE